METNKKGSEEERKLNSNIYSRNRDKTLNYYNSYDPEKNHLKYYNEIASHNAQEKMDFPTFKEIERITRDESCLNILKAKEKEKSKDLPKILDDLPLKRVERITYKSKEIGHMRRALGEYCLNNPFVYINKEKGEKFAQSIFEKRLKRKNQTKFGISIDDLYKKNKVSSRENKTLINRTNNQSWVKKYKTIGNEESEKRNIEIKEKIIKNYSNNFKTNKSSLNENRNDIKNNNNKTYFNIKANENNKNIKMSSSQGRRRILKVFENPEKESKTNNFNNSKNTEIKRREYKTINVNEEEKDKDINNPLYITNYIYNNNRRNHQISSIEKDNKQEKQIQKLNLKYKINTSNIFNQRKKVGKNESLVLKHRNTYSNLDLNKNKMVTPKGENNKNNVDKKRAHGDSQIEFNVKRYDKKHDKKNEKNNVKVSYYSSTLKVNK